MTILVTGGAGYIGSHAVLRLLRDGRRVVVVDNLVRGRPQAIKALQTVAQGRLSFVQGDVGDRDLMARVIIDSGVDTVIHFAALAYVGESVDDPVRYYRANAVAGVSLLEAFDAAAKAGRPVTRMVFSSTCATYGEPPPEMIPIPEACPQSPINPYGRSKLHVEHMLTDYAEACRRRGQDFSHAALRYFNVAGADRSGLIGEDHDPETHLIPIVLQAALGLRPHVTIFGTDYPTPDGTCIRDYVHVEDLVDAHVAVLGALRPGDRRVYNLGIGRGLSVREIIQSARRVTGREIRVVEGPRRAGDPPALFADPSRIRADLGWRASITDVDQIVSTAWAWFKAHPRGYADIYPS